MDTATAIAILALKIPTNPTLSGGLGWDKDGKQHCVTLMISEFVERETTRQREAEGIIIEEEQGEALWTNKTLSSEGLSVPIETINASPVDFEVIPPKVHIAGHSNPNKLVCKWALRENGERVPAIQDLGMLASVIYSGRGDVVRKILSYGWKKQYSERAMCNVGWRYLTSCCRRAR